ncbi:MAG: hypothetical protein IKV33_05200, partial [Alistipes sp.]|nr:hypothetical protein [Alistipes sp.]
MGYTYHIPTNRNPYGDDVIAWREEVEDLIENRVKMKILIATQKPFAAKAVEGMKEIITEAGCEVVMLERYENQQDLVAAVADADG